MNKAKTYKGYRAATKLGFLGFGPEPAPWKVKKLLYRWPVFLLDLERMKALRS